MVTLTTDAIITFATFSTAALLFISNRLRGDLIGILVILGLSLSGVLTPEESLAGFSNPVLVILVCMFVVSESVSNTGVAQRLAKNVVQVGQGSEWRLLALLMASAGLVGSFMNSTATVAVFIPLALAVCQKTNLNKRRLLIPIAAAALISGMMTLVASTQNLISNQLMITNGFDALDFFAFTPFGVCVLSAAILFMLLFGRRILGSTDPGKTTARLMGTQDLINKYGLEDKMRRFRIKLGSPLIGQNIFQTRLRQNYDVDLLAVEKPTLRGRRFIKPCPDIPFALDDTLLLLGEPDKLELVAEEKKLQLRRRLHDGVREAMLQEIGAAEILIGPDSTLIGQTLQDAQFGHNYHVNVISVRRGKTIPPHLVADRKLRFGDILLVSGGWEDILNLTKERVNFVLLTMPHESCEVLPARHKAPVTMAILALMAGGMAFEVLPTVLMAILTALALMLTGCVDIKTIYRKISWQTIVLIGGMLPLATAITKSGGSDVIALFWTSLVNGWPPMGILAALFFLTTSIGLFLPSAATAVLVIPIALEAAPIFGIPPHAMVMTATIACACPFVSPYSSPANLLAMEAGGYEFKDFIKIGMPMLLLAAGITILLAHYLYL